jgi:predicted dehydrogenase
MRRDGEKAADYARRHHIPKWYDDADKLINDPQVNAVYIATPPDVHLEYTIKCAAAGKAVYVEKPMALNYGQAKKMVEVCKEAEVPLFVALYRRGQKKFLKIRELVQNGTIGDIRAVNISMYFPVRPEDRDKNNLPWRVLPEIAGGGYFYDLAPHQLDILDFIISPITEAKGIAANLAGLYPAEDTVSASFRFESGALGTGMWTFAAQDGRRVDKAEIIGSRGKVSFAFFETTVIDLHIGDAEDKIVIANPEHAQQPLIQTIVDELLGRGKCPSTGESALRTVGVMDKIIHGKLAV